MSNMAGLNDLAAEIKQPSENIEAADARTAQRLDRIEQSVNDFLRQVRSARRFRRWSRRRYRAHDVYYPATDPPYQKN